MRDPIRVDHPTKKIRCFVPEPSAGGDAQAQHRWMCEIDGAAFDMGIAARPDGRGDAGEERAVRQRALELAGPDTGP